MSATCQTFIGTSFALLALIAGCGGAPEARAPVSSVPASSTALAPSTEHGVSEDPWVDVAIPGTGLIVSMPPDVHRGTDQQLIAHAPRSGFRLVVSYGKVDPKSPLSIPSLTDALGKALHCKATALDPHMEKNDRVTTAQFELRCTDAPTRVLVRIHLDSDAMIILAGAAPPPGNPDEAEARRFVSSLRVGPPPSPAPDTAWEKVAAPGNTFSIDMPRGAVHTKKQTESGMPYYRAQSSLPGLSNSFVALEMPWRPDAADETPEAWMSGFVIGLGRRALCGKPSSWVERDDRSPEHLVLRYEIRCPQDGNIMSGEIHWVGDWFHVLLVTLGDNEQKMSESDLVRFYSSYQPR